MTRTLIQWAAALVGLSFLAAGVLGLVPAVTTNAGDMPFAGHHSPAELLGVFEVTVLHNLVHLAFGLAGLVLAKSAPKRYLVGGGLVYLAIWIYGLVLGGGSLDFVALNEADNWLHLGAGVAMVGAGTVLSND
jgi:ABC-type transport system involved in multi-copper enzyme maturation permease subunit